MENDRRDAGIGIGECAQSRCDMAGDSVQGDHALGRALGDKSRGNIADPGKAYEMYRPVDTRHRDGGTARRSEGAMDGLHDPDAVHLIAFLESLDGAARS
jgi:hypothetical protein